MSRPHTTCQDLCQDATFCLNNTRPISRPHTPSQDPPHSVSRTHFLPHPLSRKHTLSQGPTPHLKVPHLIPRPHFRTLHPPVSDHASSQGLIPCLKIHILSQNSTLLFKLLFHLRIPHLTSKLDILAQTHYLTLRSLILRLQTLS